MHTLMVLYGQPSDPAAFRAHYKEVHLPLAQAFPGAENLRISFDVTTPGGESEYFAIFSADFADEATFKAAMRSDQGRAAQADVPNFADGGATALTLVS